MGYGYKEQTRQTLAGVSFPRCVNILKQKDRDHLRGNS